MIRIFLKLLPKRLLSFLLGKISNYSFPKSLLKFFLIVFSRFYKINLDEAKYPLTEYKTFNEFFTRHLKSSVRKINLDPKIIVSPVDGEIIAFGSIMNGKVFQVKGIKYSIYDLINNLLFAKRFSNGLFMTIYLSPSNYHRIHMPYSASVLGLEYHRATFYPVNRMGLNYINGLFTLNERLCSFMESIFGKFILVKVAALNVGRIKTVFDMPLDFNNLKKGVFFHEFISPIQLNKGEEFAYFELGSTIILLFESHRINFINELKIGSLLKYGQEIAHIN